MTELGAFMPVCDSHRPFRRSARRAFTLIELLLVLVILAILATTVALKVVGRREQAQRTAAKQDLNTINTALTAFEIDNGRFPTTEEGLAALVQNPGNLPEWSGLGQNPGGSVGPPLRLPVPGQRQGLRPVVLRPERPGRHRG